MLSLTPLAPSDLFLYPPPVSVYPSINTRIVLLSTALAPAYYPHQGTRVYQGATAVSLTRVL